MSGAAEPSDVHDGADVDGTVFARGAVGVGLGVAAFAAWTTTDAGGPALRHTVTHLVCTGAALTAALACLRAHRKRGGRHSAWFWLAVGCLVWAAGAAVWAVLEAMPGQGPAFPSLADLVLLGYAVPVVVALARFPQAPGRPRSRWRLVLDGLVVGGSLLTAVALWLLDPVLEAPASLGRRLVAVAFPVVSVSITAFLLTRSTVFSRSRRPVWLLLGAGFATLAVTDSVYVAEALRGDYQPGGALDAGWPLAFGLLTLAAFAPVADPRAPAPTAGDSPTGVYEQLLPYAAVALAVAAVLERDAVASGTPYELLVVPLALAVAVRQVVVAVDHTALARTLSDTVERRTAELRREQQWWRDLVQNLSDVVVVVDEDLSVRYCSPSAEQVLGSWPREVHDARGMVAHVHPDDQAATVAAVRPVLEGGRRQAFLECRVRRADGDWGWFEVTVLGQLAERELVGTVLTLHDVSERRRLTDRLAHEAYHDALTGLPNRSLLMHRVQEALERRDVPRPALLLIDLDDFKVINDRHGHAAGDLVLEVIGRRLRAAVRAGDTVARLGGDEFALLMDGTAEQVRAAADRLIREIGKPVLTGGRRFVVRASIGVVFAAEDQAETPHSMLSHADIALYEAKGNDKGGVVVIDGHERDAAAKQVHLREEIAAPDLDQFRVVYQPIVDLATGRMRGVEALLRWQHPELGEVAPDDFVPMAEAGGSIHLLGWFVLSECCAQLARWRALAPGHRMAAGVNISSRQLDEPGFAAQVLTLVREHGLDPEQLVLELTEQSLSRDFETAVDVVAELRAGGVSVAVDDYGTGYSSLRYLHRFDADVVKIDRSFIAYLEDSVHTQKIVRSVMEMATSLDLQSIGEGIETVGQLELLRGLGCELGQGWLFSRPLPPEGIGELLVGGRPFPVPALDPPTGPGREQEAEPGAGDDLDPDGSAVVAGRLP